MSLFRFRNPNRKSFFNSRNQQYNTTVKKIINKMFGKFIIINENIPLNQMGGQFYVDNK